MTAPSKLKHATSIWLTTVFLGIYLREMKPTFTEKPPRKCYHSFIHNKLGTAQMSFNSWMTINQLWYTLITQDHSAQPGGILGAWWKVLYFAYIGILVVILWYSFMRWYHRRSWLKGKKDLSVLFLILKIILKFIKILTKVTVLF